MRALALCCLAKEDDTNHRFGRDGTSVFGPTSDDVATLYADATRVSCSPDAGLVMRALLSCCLANKGNTNLSFGRDGASVVGPTSDDIATLFADAARMGGGSDAGRGLGALALCCLANEDDTNLSFGRGGASVFGPTFGDVAAHSAGATRVACS